MNDVALGIEIDCPWTLLQPTEVQKHKSSGACTGLSALVVLRVVVSNRPNVVVQFGVEGKGSRTCASLTSQAAWHPHFPKRNANFWNGSSFGLF